MPLAYLISPEEKRLIINKAISRHSNHYKSGAMRNKRGAWNNCEHPNMRSHVIGMMGEYATAKFLGLDITQIKHDTQGTSDGGIDITMGQWKITVKTRHQMDMPDVLWPVWKTDKDVSQDVNRSDVLVACSLTCKRSGTCYCPKLMDDEQWILVLLHGYIPTVCINALGVQKVDLGYGPRWLFPKKQLLPMKSLLIEIHRSTSRGALK